MNRVFKLVNDEIIIGDAETVYSDNPNGEPIGELLIKRPFTAKSGNIMPYLVSELTSAPAAIQIHPMNVLWALPLDEFPEAEKVYVKATSSIIL